jgi:hypothetical protein
MASMSMRSPGDCVAALDPARRTGEIEAEGVFARGGPFGDDASVVVGRASKARPMARLRSTRCIHTSR